MSMKVGELYAELGLDDLMSKALDKAEARLMKASKNMDAEARLDLDDSRFDSALRSAVSNAEDAAGVYTAELGLDTSGVDAGAAEGEQSVLDMIGGWTTVGVGAAAGVGLLIGNALMDAIGEVIDRGQLNDKITAALGFATQGERDRATKLIRQLFIDGFGGSYEEAGKAISAVLSTTEEGLTATDGQISQIAQQAQTVADIFGIDVAEAVLDAQVLVRNGLAPDMTAAFDLIVAGARRIPDALKGDFFDILSEGEYIKALKSLGITGEEAFGQLQAGARDGSFILDKVGDALKELSIRGADMSDSTVQALSSMGLDARKIADGIIQGGDAGRRSFDQIIDGLRKVKDPAQRSQDAIALLGTQMEDLGISDLDKVLASLDSMDSKLGDVEGAAQRAGDVAYDNFATKWDTALRHFDLGALADTFSRDGFEGLRQQLGEGVDSLKAIWDEYGPAVTEILGEGWDEIVAWWEDPEGGQKVLDQAEAWWNDTAMPALGDAAGNALSGAWNYALGAAGDWLSDPGNWTDFLKNFSFPGAQFYDTVKGWVQDTVEATPEWLGGMVDNVERFITEQLGPTIAANAAHLWDSVPEAFKTALNAVIGLWNGLSIPAYDIGPWEVPTSPWTTQSVGPFTIGGIDFPDIPTFHTGGQVDVPGGGPGAEMMAVLQRGERVLTAGQQSVLDRFLAGQTGPSNAGAGGLTIEGGVHITAPDARRGMRDAIYEARVQALGILN